MESASIAVEPRGDGLGARLKTMLPRGGSLPTAEWERRHRALRWILWLNAVVLPIYGVLAEGYNALHTLEHALILVALAALAGYDGFGRKLRSVCASLGMLTAAALLVHLTDGLIEAHFYFFVLIVALTLYEDWLPFLIAVGFVLLHHGVVGTIAPHEVYNQPEAWANPWAWAGVHAFFVALAGAAGIVAWRLNESVRDRMREAQQKLAVLSETDSLTDLCNRRKAMADLAQICAAAPGKTAILVLLDLDGFKAYNDTFGHPAGDALLARLGLRLRESSGEDTSVYRLGGDEFCILASGSGEDERARIEATAAASLSESGPAFSVTASYGSVLVPGEATTPAEAMRLADQRMYARKTSSRPSALSQSKDVLLTALIERHPDLGAHVDEVRALVQPIGEALGMDVSELQALRHAAELHDIGKVAIPDAILRKPGPLNDPEWEFIRGHTVIGQRIVAAAPALSAVGELIRASHERWDGKGYPDGLAGEEIPIGARVIAVCDAYDAMTTDRPYRISLRPEDALAELRHCAGSQFDPSVVEAFAAEMTSRRRAVQCSGRPMARPRANGSGNGYRARARLTP